MFIFQNFCAVHESVNAHYLQPNDFGQIMRYGKAILSNWRTDSQDYLLGTSRKNSKSGPKISTQIFRWLLNVCIGKYIHQ